MKQTSFKDTKKYPADSILTYFHAEKKYIIIIAITGIIYNVGMLAGPWFEGQLVQYFYDLLQNHRVFSELLTLAIAYIITILFVQIARAFKRFYVRRFANNISLSFKENLYQSMLHRDPVSMSQDDAGTLMTKAVSDADECTEGMRKFTTEVFDTGLVMIAYGVMLFAYDWKLTLITMLFPPIAYVMAGLLRKTVARTSAATKKAADHLNNTIIDRTVNAITYRSYGLEQRQREIAEDRMNEYESAAIKAGTVQNASQPIYYAISMTSVIFIFMIGGKNVLGTGWSVWTIASFTTYLSCFTKLAVKASKSAKLFNAVQKAEVSWKRIKPLLKDWPNEKEPSTVSEATLEVKNASFAYEGSEPLFRNVSFSAHPGDIIGITGPIASGKSSLGRIFLRERPYEGTVTYNGKDISAYTDIIFGYAGHDPELFTGTIKDNICMGHIDESKLYHVLEEVCMLQDLSTFEEGLDTIVGEDGIRLSGGQQARISLARALYSDAPVLILDDPFSAVDQRTEEQIFASLKKEESNRIILLISHRLHLFPEMNQVIWIKDGDTDITDHHSILHDNAEYKELYELQEGESDE